MMRTNYCPWKQESSCLLILSSSQPFKHLVILIQLNNKLFDSVTSHLYHQPGIEPFKQPTNYSVTMQPAIQVSA